MKALCFYSAVAIFSLFGTSTFAAGTCTNGGGNGGVAPTNSPVYGSNLPVYSAGFPGSPAGASGFPTAPFAAARPTAPTARITVVDSTPSTTTSNSRTAPAAHISLASATETAAPKSEIKPSESAPQKTEIAKAEESTLPAALKGLTGTWLAVARHGDGELGTIELQLDERGTAKLTVPGADGKPSTVERSVNLEDQELKLKGAGAELSLGKLIESNDRQIVLARADGNVTFVRP